MLRGVRFVEAEIDYYTSIDDSGSNRCFVVYTDASLLGLGGILMQTQRVITYAS